MTLPNFLVIGAQRAGTSLLHKILDRHPEIYVPTQRKEIHFFDRYFERGPDWYQRYFPAVVEAGSYAAIGEVTPDYLTRSEVPARIHELLPDIRLIAILRNPVDRAFSWYQYACRSRYEQRAFEQFLEEDPLVLEAGLYHRNLARYLERFAREQTHVMIYEELVHDPARELGVLASFLGLAKSWVAPELMTAERVNTSAIPKYRGAYAAARDFGKLLMHYDLNWPGRIAKGLGVYGLFGRAERAGRLADEERHRLGPLYREDAAALAALLGRQEPIWQL